MKNIYRSMLGAAAVGVGVLAVAGLASASPAATTPIAQNQSAAEAAQSDSQRRLPLDDLIGVGRAEYDRDLHISFGESLEECARNVGVDYQHPDPGATPPRVSSQFGLIDIDHAGEHGYMPPDEITEEEANWINPITSLSVEDQETLDRAFFGDDPEANSFDVKRSDGELVGGYTVGNGCVVDAYTTFYGSWEQFRDFSTSEILVEDAWRRSVESVQASIEYQSVRSDWASCMQTAGFASATNPLELFDRDWGGNRPTEEETATAVADVECKTQTDLVDRARAIAADTQAALIANDDLEQHVRAVEAVVQR